MAEACWRHKHKRTKKNVKRVLILITKAKSLHAQLNFCTFLCCHYTTTTWKRVISRSIEGKTSHDEVHFSFWTWIWFLGIQPQERWPKILTKLVSWNNADEDWEREFTSSATFSPPVPSSDLKVPKTLVHALVLAFCLLCWWKTSFIAPKPFYEI